MSLTDTSVGVREYDITDIVRNSPSKDIIEFSSNHFSEEDGLKKHTSSSAYVRITDIDLPFVLDWRGYPDIIYLADNAFKEEAQGILLNRVIQSIEDEIESKRNSLLKLTTRLEAIKKNYSL